MSLNPYESPRAPTSTSPLNRAGFLAFRTRFLRFFLASMLLGAACDVATVLLMRLLNPAVTVRLANAMIVWMLALQAIGFALACVYFKVYVSPRGIRSFDVWGNYDYTDWDTIHRVRPISIMGFEYLRIDSPQLRRPLWLPLYIARAEQFWAYVLQHAPDESPLRTAPGVPDQAAAPPTPTDAS